MKMTRHLVRFIGPALLLAGSLAASTGASYAADVTSSHTDGYLSVNNGCLILRQHDGALLSLVGDTAGLLSGDHVRLEGRLVPDPGCGTQGFAVSLVQTLWADDNHRTTNYDHLNGEAFGRFAERTGRFDDRDANARGDEGIRHDQGGERAKRSDERTDRSDRRERSDRSELGDQRDRRDEGDAGGRDRDQQFHQDRRDRNGRYVYQGAHRNVTLVGKIHESAGACPTLETSYTTFMLEGNLREYQAGDSVKVSGVLYDHDPSAPCGGPTVVIEKIRGR